MRVLYVGGQPTAAGEIEDNRLADLYRHRLPSSGGWLRTNFVTSLDGSIQGIDGRSGSINTPSDNFVFALHRAHADAILVGAQTVRAEGYRAVDLQPWQRELRDREGLAPFPLLAVVTRSLDLNPGMVDCRAGECGPVMIITTKGKRPADVARFVEAGIEVLQLDGDQVDLVKATDQLVAAGHRRILCEGGSHLHRDLLGADLVDEMSLTIAPVAVGGDGQRTTAGDVLSEAAAFELSSALHADDGTLFLNYCRAR
jgi:riboflavin biosynthesis pyrimidine reductase